jgi:hypothetical protein
VRRFAFTEQVSECRLIARNSFLSTFAVRAKGVECANKKTWHNYIAEGSLSTSLLLGVQGLECVFGELNVEKMKIIGISGWG